MSGSCSSPRVRAEHYRALAALTSDEAVHRILLEMADEAEACAKNGAERPALQLRSYS
jgi:hypothetical protein